MSAQITRDRRATWRRVLCELFGHRTVGIFDLFTGEKGAACLRCWGTSIIINRADAMTRQADAPAADDEGGRE